jgi:hypothetical protein
MAVGGVLQADLLAPPPPAKRTSKWLIRQVTPLASEVSPVPYPIPPAGVHAAEWRGQEAPPALTFTVPVPADVVVPLVAATADLRDKADGGAAAVGGGEDAGQQGAAAGELTEGQQEQQQQESEQQQQQEQPEQQQEHQEEQQQKQRQQQQQPVVRAAGPRVGWWNEATCSWSEEGVR